MGRLSARIEARKALLNARKKWRVKRSELKWKLREALGKVAMPEKKVKKKERVKKIIKRKKLKRQKKISKGRKSTPKAGKKRK